MIPMKKIFPFFSIAIVMIFFAGCGGDNSDDVKKGNGGGTGNNNPPPAQNNYNVTNSGMTAYTFTGNGLTNATNPSLTLTKGVTYTFNINASGHPFWIKFVQGTGNSNAYSSGISGNGTDSGTLTFTVPSDAPATLFYNCQIHASMTGTITIVSP